jgi:two-component system sensor kinase FixL
MSVLNNAADQIQLTDRDLRYVMVNRATLASLGMPGQENRVLGRRASEILPPETGQRVEELDTEVLATGEHRVLEMDWTVSGMAPRIVAMTKSPWRDVAGQVSGVVTILRDVTAQRRAEARLRAVQADLLRATRLSAMGAMGSGLGHELNQPLAAATNFLNAAVRMLDSVDEIRDWARVSGGVREAVGEAAAQMLRAGAIVRSLRQFVERGEIELDIADLGPLVREACDLARADGAIGPAKLVAWVPETVGLALVDRTQMHQVLLNLIRNAAEALEGKPDGRIAVSATRDSTSLTGGALVITVTDNGPGLDPDVAGRLFEPFVSTKPTGLGIGLAISRTIVEGHGGRLLAKPAEGGGTAFRILLPAVQPPATRDLILSDPKAGS